MSESGINFHSKIINVDDDNKDIVTRKAIPISCLHLKGMTKIKPPDFKFLPHSL